MVEEATKFDIMPHNKYGDLRYKNSYSFSQFYDISSKGRGSLGDALDLSIIYRFIWLFSNLKVGILNENLKVGIPNETPLFHGKLLLVLP